MMRTLTRIGRVTFQEYRHYVFRWRFVLVLLTGPILLLMMAGVVGVMAAVELEPETLGTVDASGVLAVQLPESSSSVLDPFLSLRAFDTEAEAEAALKEEAIQAYYVFPADYLETGHVRLIYLKEPKPLAQVMFEQVVTAKLLASQPAAVARRLTEGARYMVRSADGTRDTSPRGLSNLLFPLAGGAVFFWLVSTNAGYLSQVIAREKENRTLEVLITSVSTGELITGKILGLVGIGLTPFLLWGIVIGLLLTVGRSLPGLVAAISIEPGLAGLTALVVVAGFVLVAALLVGLGAMFVDAREGQKITGIISSITALPYWLFWFILNQPNGPLAVGLSLFPLTAPAAMTLRAGVTRVPLWQSGLSAALLVLSALGALWVSGKLYRLGMLRYGQQPIWRQVVSRFWKS